VATFFILSVARANTGYTLIALAAGLPGVESVPFDVLIGPASHLDFQTRPHDEIAGRIIGDPYVQLRGGDAGGNLDTTFTGLVTVVIGNNPGGGDHHAGGGGDGIRLLRQPRDRVYRQCDAHDRQQSRRGNAERDDDGDGGGGGRELRGSEHQQRGRGLHAPGGVGGAGGRDQRDIRHQLGSRGFSRDP